MYVRMYVISMYAVVHRCKRSPTPCVVFTFVNECASAAGTIAVGCCTRWSLLIPVSVGSVALVALGMMNNVVGRKYPN